MIQMIKVFIFMFFSQ